MWSLALYVLYTVLNMQYDPWTAINIYQLQNRDPKSYLGSRQNYLDLIHYSGKDFALGIFWASLQRNTFSQGMAGLYLNNKNSFNSSKVQT